GRTLLPLLFLHEELGGLVLGLIDLLGVQAARVDGLLEVAASFLVLLLRIRDAEQDSLDGAALVWAQVIELQRVDLRRSPLVVLHVQELDRLIEDLARLRVDAVRPGGRRFFLFVSGGRSARALVRSVLAVARGLSESRPGKRDAYR